ncbi:MAG: HAD family acid phosphatase [Vicinamibacterales bacterium]
MRRLLSVAVLAVTLASCHPRGPIATPPAAGPPAGAPAAAATAEPPGITWVRSSAEYEAATRQAYRIAGEKVAAAAAGRAPGTWAVVLDADETVISNVVYQAERARAGMGYTAESWDAWVRREAATPVPGAAEFLADVRARGGRIAIVTNRLGSQCAATEAVFRRDALVFDAMLCRPDGAPSDKAPRFDAVAAGATSGGRPVEILAFLGDNILDFPGLQPSARGTGADGFASFGERYFLLPNPMYGSWQ